MPSGSTDRRQGGWYSRGLVIEIARNFEDATMAAALALISALLMAGAAPADPDLDKLQGAWVLSTLKIDGEDVPPENFKG